MPAEVVEQIDSGLDTEHLVGLVQQAIQTVQCPFAYVPTGRALTPRDEAAGAERGKAMTGLMLFMIEGLVRSIVRARDKGIVDVPSMVRMAWRRWLCLHRPKQCVGVNMDGWLAISFPAPYLTTDKAVLSMLAGCVEMETSTQAGEIGVLISDFFLPAYVFDQQLGTIGLASDLTRILGGTVVPFTAAIDSSPAALDPVTISLAADFVRAVTGTGDPDRARYPGY